MRRNNNRRRDTSDITNRRLSPADLHFLAYTPYSNELFTQRVNLRQIEDRRTYDPLGRFRPVRTLFGSQRPGLAISRQYSPKNRSRYVTQFPSPGVRFRDPDRVVTCVRRSIRKQVMHAFGFAGTAGRGRKSWRKPRYNNQSFISCVWR